MTQTEKHALWAQEEQNAEMHGWDFSHIRGRVVEAPLPWDYKQKVLDFLKPQSVILDMGTGGGGVPFVPAPPVFADKRHGKLAAKF